MEQVCDMAVTLFRHQGIRATPMEDVRMSLDISKDVFYGTFPDKETLQYKIRYKSYVAKIKNISKLYPTV